jgi:hypothetical protein
MTPFKDGMLIIKKLKTNSYITGRRKFEEFNKVRNIIVRACMNETNKWIALKLTFTFLSNAKFNLFCLTQFIIKE